MKNYILIILSVLICLGGCSKEDSKSELEVSAEGKMTGKVNGTDIGMATIFSDVSGTGDAQTMYITARKNLESLSKAATNGKQFLIRVQPYKGVGNYTVSANSFWTYMENINIVDNNNSSDKTHSFGSTDTKGSMSVEITSDKTEGGKRVIRGKFSGESGSTIQTDTKLGKVVRQTLTLEAFKLTDISFIAPHK